MRILILGGAGFIGSHLCDYFLERGHYVICLDNLLTGSMANIEHNIKHKRFKYIKQDINKPINITGKIDWVLNFASPASPKDYENLPIETLKAGSLGTLNALECARDKRAGFFMASTSEVYGDPSISPQNESYWGNVSSVGPRSCYDEAKRFSEALTMAYHRKYGVDVRLARIFNTYGPRMRQADGRVIPNFISQVLANQPLTIYGRGQQTRSFCFIADLIEGINRLINFNGLFTREQDRIFNLGNPNEFTILNLAKVLSEICGQPLALKYKPLPQDDPRQRRPDILRAWKKLKWKPEVELEDGLKMTLAWHKEAYCYE